MRVMKTLYADRLFGVLIVEFAAHCANLFGRNADVTTER